MFIHQRAPAVLCKQKRKKICELWPLAYNLDHSKKFQQFTKLCKSDMSQNSKTAKMFFRRYHRVLNFRFALISPLQSFVNCWSFLLWFLLF